MIWNTEAIALKSMRTPFRERDRCVVIVDASFWLAGGTTEATADLVNRLGGVVTAMVYFIELEELKGREKLSCPVVTSLVKL